jgi:iron complex outermembrane receptor protein
VKKQKLSAWIWLFTAVSVLGTLPARADVVNVSAVQHKIGTTNAAAPIKDIPRLSEIQRPYTSVKDWVAQQTQQNQLIQVTGVRLSPKKNGLEVILETPASDKLQSTIKSEGNTFSAVISNAQLRLPSGNTFRADKPTDGITAVTVTNLDANSIQVTVTGETGLPTVELFDSNSGLIFAFTPTASSVQQQQQQQQTPQTNKPSRETPQAKPSASGEEPIELVVTGEQEGSYNPSTADTATKLRLQRRDIPQSIQVIPRQVIEDRKVIRLDELTENVSGVRREPGYGNLSSAGFRVRGFRLGFENLRNGFRDIGYLSPREVANVERVEFLKGPASVLYGGSGSEALSGAVNTVTKKPLAEPFYNATFTAGSYSFYRPTIDISGPLTTDKSLLYRLNLAYENAGSFRDFGGNESFFISPALTWKIGKRTDLTVEFEHLRYDNVFDSGFPLLPESLRLPSNRYLEDPNFSHSNIDSTSITYNFEHRFSDNWRFRQGFNTILTNYNSKQLDIYSSDLLSDRRTLPREALKTDEETHNYTLQNEIFGKFNTGSVKHNFLLGAELARYDFNFAILRGTFPEIDIFAPQYRQQPGELGSRTFSGYGSDLLGIYVQDLVEILPNLKILAGARFDSNEATRKNLLNDTVIFRQSLNEVSPRVGIVYQPSDTTSLYFNWSKAFAPVFYGQSRTDEPFKPIMGEQFEVGIKQDFLDNKLSATLALYQITKQNVLTPDPVDRTYRIQTGEQRSRGIELDVAGEILPGWNVIATYAYTNAEVTSDNSIPVGNKLVDVPDHSASLWTTYKIQSGDLQGLGFGVGLVYAGSRQVSLPNTFKTDSYLKTDAAIYYQRGNYQLALNIKNLFDIKYFYNSQEYFLYPGAPLTVLGTVSIQF